MYPKSINNLIEAFKYFPGIGEKTAERMAFHVLSMEDIQTDFLAESIKNAKSKIKRCKICNHISEDDICYICNDSLRNKDYLCVVEDPKTVISIEKLGTFNGYYHVLNGLIETLDGINPEDIRLDKLIKRLEENNFKEVIIAVKPCLEGEMTALYINNVLSGMGVVVSRLASGIPMGADMEYIDPITLEKAFDNRKKYHNRLLLSYFIIGDKVKVIFKYIKKVILGGVMLYAYNLIAVTFNMTLPINIFTIITVGLLDIPGLAALIILKTIGM